MRDAHLRRLRAEGYSISEMARELRASQHMVQVRVREQKAEEREEREEVVSGPPAPIHKGWLS
jgi:predicted transcriptional regulator